MPSALVTPQPVAARSAIAITGLAPDTVTGVGLVWGPDFHTDSTVSVGVVAATGAIVQTLRPSANSVTFSVETVATRSYIIPFIATTTAAIAAVPAVFVVVPLVPTTIAAVAAVPEVMAFSLHDTWRPRAKPDMSVVLACRTSPGDHDTVLTGITLWTFQLGGFDGILDGSEDLMAKGLPSDNGWITYGHPEWDAAGDRVIIWAETVSDYQLVTLDGGETFGDDMVIHSVTKPDTVSDPSYGPDDSIVFVEQLGGDYYISMYGAGATPYDQLLSKSNVLADPTISPNGLYVLFTEQTAAIDGGHPYGQWALKYVRLSNLAETTIYNTTDANLHPVWYDNNTVLFQTLRTDLATPDTEFKIAKVKRNGTGITILGTGEYPQAVRI